MIIKNKILQIKIKVKEFISPLKLIGDFFIKEIKTKAYKIVRNGLKSRSKYLSIGIELLNAKHK